MSLTKSTYDNFHRDLAPAEPQYGQQCEEERPNEDGWPSEQELADDERDRR